MRRSATPQPHPTPQHPKKCFQPLERATRARYSRAPPTLALRLHPNRQSHSPPARPAPYWSLLWLLCSADILLLPGGLPIRFLFRPSRFILDIICAKSSSISCGVRAIEKKGLRGGTDDVSGILDGEWAARLVCSQTETIRLVLRCPTPAKASFCRASLANDVSPQGDTHRWF